MEQEGKTPQVTLKNGVAVGAREAVAIWQRLGMLPANDPEAFQSLLALAQDRPSDADPRHFKRLRARVSLERDERTIRAVVREVLLNTYRMTPEGPVLIELQLRDLADQSVVDQAKEDLRQFDLNMLFGRGGKGKGRE